MAYAAPVLLAYRVTRRKNRCSQVSLAAGCLSLLFSVYFLIRYVCWKAAGNYDAQEAIGFVFLFIYQFGISLVAMLLGVSAPAIAMCRHLTKKNGPRHPSPSCSSLFSTSTMKIPAMRNKHTRRERLFIRKSALLTLVID